MMPDFFNTLSSFLFIVLIKYRLNIFIVYIWFYNSKIIKILKIYYIKFNYRV